MRKLKDVRCAFKTSSVDMKFSRVETFGAFSTSVSQGHGALKTNCCAIIVKRDENVKEQIMTPALHFVPRSDIISIVQKSHQRGRTSQKARFQFLSPTEIVRDDMLPSSSTFFVWQHFESITSRWLAKNL